MPSALAPCSISRLSVLYTRLRTRSSRTGAECLRQLLLALWVQNVGTRPVSLHRQPPLTSFPSPNIIMVDASLQTLAYTAAYATFGIGLSTVLLRVYCRHFIMQAWGSDDNVALFVGVSILVSNW